MRSFSRRASSRRILELLLIAALVLVVRAPFLLRGESFFDSDEAVEGLMALHVLDGEFPAFLWGQRYKGVPEIYPAAALFLLAGPSVIALKSVTLASFALFVCLQFVLVARLFPRSIAWMATAFLIVSPPSLVLWSMSANAEVVMTMLAGTLMCLGIDLWRRTGARLPFVAAFGALGFGLWVHQYILYYCLALALATLHWLPQRNRILSGVVAAGEIPRWLRIATGVVGATAVLYAVLGTVAFTTGGFDARLLGLEIGVRHAQKLWQIALGLLLLAAAVRIWSIAARRNGSLAAHVYLAAGGFVLGYAPALAAQAAGGGGPPIGRMNLQEAAAAVPSILTDVVPIVFGFRGPDTGWLGVSAWLALPLLIGLAASLPALRGRQLTPLFHYLVFVTPIVFLLSGAFIDAQSYRYLMPISGALAVVLALGVWWIFRRSRTAGVAVFVSLLMLFALQQRAWHRQLAPDVQSRAILACLEQNGVRAVYADYWLAYKLTFLARERIVVAPINGVDRYPPYRAAAQAVSAEPSILDKMKELSCAQESSSSR
jgi:hypothetical protein